MEIEYLKEFVVLAQTKNFLEASDILYCSQSSLSKHIKCVEKELGVPLFNRTTRKVQVSKFGQLLLPYAEQILNLKEQYSSLIQSSLETDRELLTLGSIPALAQYNITDILVEFKKNSSQTTINVTQFGTEELKDKLRQRKCELAFVCETDEVDDDIEKYLYMMDELVVVLPISHPLAKEEKIPLHVLKDEDFILMNKQTKPGKLSLIACEQSGFEPKIVHTDTKLETIIDFVVKGMGVALLMKRLAQCIFNQEICAVDISPKVYAQINLCYLKDGELSDTAKQFVECVKSQKMKANIPRLIGVPTQTYYVD